MKIFMTGATGFIGSAVARRLRDSGHELACLVRNPSKAALLDQIGCEIVSGHLDSEAEIKDGIDGADAVLHGAAIYEVGVPGSRRAELERVNVTGTERVLTAALEASVPKVLYVSSAVVFGNTAGEVADEGYRRPSLEFTSVYEETKYRAHQIALKMIAEQGLPCVIAQPAGVYGPGDHSALAQTVNQFVDGKLPLLPFPGFGTGLAHVDDIAEGIVLCLEKGEPGEAYLLNSANTTMRDLIGDVADLLGRKPPAGSMPTWLLKALRPIGPVVGKIMGQPPNLAELIRSADGVTFWVTAEKARRELGFDPRPLEQMLKDTLVAENRLPAA